MEETKTKRIVLLGKTGAGKSSLANTIFEEDVFKVKHTFNSETKKCKAKTRSVNGRRITLIDTPGFFETNKPEKKLRSGIVRCIRKCAPGPHAFLIVLKVETFTEQERDIIRKIYDYFSEEAFKYAAVVFTHGDQLPEQGKIEELVHQNKDLSDLVEKCGSRCHIIDNTHWKNNQQSEYRSNQFQVKQLLNTIDKITEANKGHYYTNDMLQTVERMIKQKGKRKFKKMLKKSVSINTGTLLGAFLGVPTMISAVINALKKTPAEVAGDAVGAEGVAAVTNG